MQVSNLQCNNSFQEEYKAFY